MKNTFIWGFNYDLEEVIADLQSKDLINVKAWFKDNKLPNDLCFNISDFFSDSWINKYNEKIKYYSSNGSFQQEIYNKVYAKIYTFQDLYSRHDKANQTRKLHSYLHMFNLIYRFIFGILTTEKIELILFSNIPHEGPDIIIYELAKALNIKTILLNQSPYANKYFYFDSLNDYGEFKLMEQRNNDSDVKIEKKFFKDHWYMKNIKTYKFPICKIFRKLPMNPCQILEKITQNCSTYYEAQKYIKNLKKFAAKVDYDKKFVYFPLHLQPELTTSALGGAFCDQLLALEILSEIIPNDWCIYVKENPKQTEFMRPEIFFKRLQLIKKVKLTPCTENTFKLIEKSQFVATITGTAAWESITGGKPALIFGNIWFQNLPGIFKYNEDFKVEDLLNYKIEHSHLEKELNKLINKMGDGVVDRDYEILIDNYSKEQNTITVSKLLEELISKEEAYNETSIGHCPIRA